MLRGLPDLSAPLPIGGAPIFAPFGGVGDFACLPERLVVATRPDGAPALRVQQLRRAGGGGHGALELAVRAEPCGAAPRDALRALAPGAELGLIGLAGGFLRLCLADGATVLGPIALAWNELDTAIFRALLEPAVVSVVRDALLGGTLLVTAHAELDYVGVSPRLPVRAVFDPRALLAALPATGDPRLLCRERLIDALVADPAALGFAVEGEVPDRRALADALADRIRERFGRPAPGPAPASGATWFAVASPDEQPPGRFVWELAEARAATRTVALGLDPFEDARRAIAARGPAGVFEQRELPRLPTGEHAITVAAPALPAHLRADVAVTVIAPPTALRRHAAIDTVELLPPGYAATARLRLAPDEPLAYCYRVEVADERGAVTAGAEARADGALLHVPPSALPVELVRFEATPRLLALPELRALSIVARVQLGERALEARLSLTAAQPAGALALRRDRTATRFVAEAFAADGQVVRLELGDRPPARLDLASFPGYGPHAVELSCDFPGGVGTAVFELCPDGSDRVTTLRLTGAAPITYRYFADSPFRPGFRIRPPRPRAAPAPWSAPQPPDRALRLAPPAATTPLETPC